MLVYSPLVSKFIAEDCGFELQAKSDYRFIEQFYKLMFRYFDNYKPQITIQQFFTNGFGECKVCLCIDVIQKMREKHRELVSNQNLNKAMVKQTTPPAPEQPRREIYSLTGNSAPTSEDQAPRVVRHKPAMEQQPEMMIDELDETQQPVQYVKKDDLASLIKALAESVSGLGARFDKMTGVMD